MVEPIGKSEWKDRPFRDRMSEFHRRSDVAIRSAIKSTGLKPDHPHFELLYQYKAAIVVLEGRKYRKEDVESVASLQANLAALDRQWGLLELSPHSSLAEALGTVSAARRELF